MTDPWHPDETARYAPDHPPPPGPPPPWIVAPPAEAGPPPAREPGRSRFGIVLACVAAVILVIAGLGVVALRRFGGAPEAQGPSITWPVGDTGDTGDAGDGQAPAGPPAFQPPATEATTEPPAEPPATEPPAADPQEEALARLEELSSQNLAQVSLDGRYVAQLASKAPGISDPYQVAADGTHVFQATDILREHEQLRDDPRNGDAAVVLLRSTDYGKRQRYRDGPLYVTFALSDFGGERAVRTWCARRFTGLTADALANQCAVRRLRPAA